MRAAWIVNDEVGASGRFEVAGSPVILRAAVGGDYAVEVQVGDAWTQLVIANIPAVLGSGATALVIVTPGRYRVRPMGAAASGDRVVAEFLAPDEAAWFSQFDVGSVADVFLKYVQASGIGRVTWGSIIGRPSSAPSDIDDAVAKRHEHQAALADIDDAVTKRHEHGASLTAIDQAAAWAHQHTDLAALEAAVPLAHQHQSSLTDIDDAVAKRHQHAAALADIDDAAAKRHEHANKVLLDTVALHDWGGGDPDGTIVGTPYINNTPVMRAAIATEVITVAPDAASRQPGDWGRVGWDGVVSAFKAAHSVKQTGGQFVEIYLRPGTYVATAPLASSGTGGARIRIRALQPPTLPGPTQFSFHNGGTPNRAADVALVDAAYSTIIEFDSWALAWFYEQAQVYFNDILFRATNGGTVGRARHSFLHFYNCAAVGCNYAALADYNGTVRWDGGVVIADLGAFGASRGGYLRAASYAGAQLVCGYGLYGAYAYEGGMCEVDCTAGNEAVFGALPRQLARSYRAATVRLNRTIAEQCGLANQSVLYASDGAHIAAVFVESQRNPNRVALAQRHSMIELNNCLLPPDTTPDIARTIRADSNSTIRAVAFQAGSGTPVYDPVLGTSGNLDGIITA